MRQPKKFCSLCGGKLVKTRDENRERLVCAECGQISYENPLPATCAVLLDCEGNILLTRRAVEPALGEWSLPGGFVEIDENPEECILREIEEETGLTGRIVAQIGVRGQKSGMYINIMIAGFLVKAVGGDLRAGDDASEVRWFNRATLPELPFESHTEFLRKALDDIGGFL